MGFDPTQSAQSHMFNTRNLISLFISSCCIVSIVLYVIYMANNFREYINAIDIISTTLFINLSFEIYMMKMGKTFEIINRRSK